MDQQFSIDIYNDMISDTSKFIKSKLPSIPKAIVELGTGQNGFVNRIKESFSIPYEEIPNFPVSTAPFHLGQLVYGHIDEKPVLIMQGRFHPYEGYSYQQVTFPIRVFNNIGIQILVVCNGGGSVNPLYKVGDLMLIRDHINLMWGNPLVGPNDDDKGPRFLDMTDAYSPELRAIARRIASNENITLHEGVYVANLGPTYETPAETMMAFRLGGDLVGMSSVPDVIVARHMNMKVLGISQVGNLAAGLNQGKLEDPQFDPETYVNEEFASLLTKILFEIL